MRFTLIYDGELRPRQRGVSRDKAALRRQFHRRLRHQITPFLEGSIAEYLSSRVADAEFICLAVAELDFRAELDVLLMSGGDGIRAGELDNRVKALVDGLTRPRSLDQMQGFQSPEDGGPTFCLLEDDSLVSSLSVERRRWLGRPAAGPDVLAVVNVTMTKAKPTYAAMSLGF